VINSVSMIFFINNLLVFLVNYFILLELKIKVNHSDPPVKQRFVQ